MDPESHAKEIRLHLQGLHLLAVLCEKLTSKQFSLPNTFQKIQIQENVKCIWIAVLISIQKSPLRSGILNPRLPGNNMGLHNPHVSVT
jgi:hypothetical protein